MKASSQPVSASVSPGWGGHAVRCEYCLNGQENLCRQARYTGYQIDGGFAEYTLADARYCFPIPDGYTDAGAAPLLCAGLIGYRSYRMCGNVVSNGLDLYGFGASAHIIAQIAVYPRASRSMHLPGRWTRKNRPFAHSLGAVWAGVVRMRWHPKHWTRPLSSRRWGRWYRRHCMRSGRGACSGLCRDLYERYPVFCLFAAVGGTCHPFGGQSYPQGW